VQIDDVFLKPEPHHPNVIRPDFQAVQVRDVGRRLQRPHPLGNDRRRGNGSFDGGNLGAFPIFPSVQQSETAGEQEVQQLAGGVKSGLLEGTLLRTQAQPFGKQPVSETPQRRPVQLDGGKANFRRHAWDRP
jgi:hypothetical protein